MAIILYGPIGARPVTQTINKWEPENVKTLWMEDSAMVTTKKSENVVRILFTKKTLRA